MYLRCLQESLGVHRVDCLSRGVPTGVVSVASIGACIDTRLLELLNFLVLQALFDLKELLRRRVLVWVASGAHGGVPLGSLGA